MQNVPLESIGGLASACALTASSQFLLMCESHEASKSATSISVAPTRLPK
jgi:hypothetical protein